MHPLIFRKEIYAIASIISGLMYTGLLAQLGEGILIQLIAIASTIGIRFIAYHYQVRLPQFSYKSTDKTPAE